MKNKLYSVGLIVLFQIVQTTTGNAQEWSFGGEIGATLISFFQYTPAVEQEGASYGRGYRIPHNEGWLLSYYPAHKNVFFSLAYTRFHPSDADILVKLDYGARSRQIKTAPFDHTISLNVGHQIDIGTAVSLKRERLFFEPLYGIGLQLLQGGIPIPYQGLITLEDYVRERGINPSLQTGFRLSYRYRRSKFSIKALGNLGFNYHSETQYRVWFPEETILATFRSKSDFIAAQVSYEYIFKSNNIEKRNKQANSTAQFTRQKIKELKIGIHPLSIGRIISVNYEQFPVRQAKSLFVDLTYFNVKRSLSSNISEDPNNPIFIYRTYTEPHLDIRFGRHIFSEKVTANKWGVGYHIRSEFKLAKSQKYRNDFEQKHGEFPDSSFSYFFGIGASLQYKWLIKDRIVISPMVLTDLGVGSPDMDTNKYPLFFEPAFFDVQARIYIGYRF